MIKLIDLVEAHRPKLTDLVAAAKRAAPAPVTPARRRFRDWAITTEDLLELVGRQQAELPTGRRIKVEGLGHSSHGLGGLQLSIDGQFQYAGPVDRAAKWLVESRRGRGSRAWRRMGR